MTNEHGLEPQRGVKRDQFEIVPIFYYPGTTIREVIAFAVRIERVGRGWDDVYSCKTYEQAQGFIDGYMKACGE